MKKNLFQRMIRSKGAWIGAFLYLFLSIDFGYFFEYGGFYYKYIIPINHFLQLPLKIFSFELNIQNFIFVGIILMLVGFIIGYFIETKLFKKRK